MSKAGRKREKKDPRRAARETKEAERDSRGLVGAVRRGDIEIVTSDSPQKAPVRITIPAEKATVPALAPAKPAPQKVVEIPITKAGEAEYDAFFRLYHLWVKAQFKVRLNEGLAGQGGMYFLPLGFIPGPAILLSFREGQIQGTEATPDVKKGLKLPATWTKVAEMPQRMQEALEEWKTVVEGLGYEPSPWNFGLARRVLGGQLPSKYLSMMMPRFRYRPGDPELPFGIVLVPVEDEMKVERVYNPQGIPDVPAMDTVLSLAILKDGKGPIQKLLRTWALMEGNYWGRYGQGNDQTKPQPKPTGTATTKVPTRRPS